MTNDTFYYQLIENLYEGIYYVDVHRKITVWNRGAEKITGYSKRDVIGRCCGDNILRHIDMQGNDLCLKGCPLAQTLRDGKAREAEVFFHHKDGHRVPVLVRVSPMADDAGKIIGAVEIFSDNSERLNTLAKLEALEKEVYTDSLTGIGNRKLCNFYLERRLHEYHLYQIPFGVLFLDIDRFKQFNDLYGHSIGDRVLSMVAQTTTNAVRGIDVVTRWGGEELAIVLPNVDDFILKQAAERIRCLIEKSWINLDGTILQVTVSIGGTIVNMEDTRSTIISRADQLMYESKKNGRNRFTILS
ncbi:MAG: sensor domain-containing diguanylate cyclase [Prochlorotrichaceae cyanobacterium]